MDGGLNFDKVDIIQVLVNRNEDIPTYKGYKINFMCNDKKLHVKFTLTFNQASLLKKLLDTKDLQAGNINYNTSGNLVKNGYCYNKEQGSFDFYEEYK